MSQPGASLAGIHSFRWYFLTVLIWFSLLAGRTCAQSFVFGVGAYHHIDPPKPTCLMEYTIDRKPSLNAELYFQHIMNTNRNTRLGFLAPSVRAIVKPKNPEADSSYDYRMISYLFSFQRKVYQKDFFYLLLGISAGPCFRNWSGPNERYNPFRNLNLGFSFQPGIYCVFRVYKIVGIQISGRFNQILTGEDFSPFSSGFDLQAGLLLVVERRK